MKDERRNFIQSWKQALSRLDEVLTLPVNDRIVIDAAIQRFEFCCELGWKTLKVCLEYEGQAALTPRKALKEAYRIQWISDELGWHQLLEDRNLASHTYHEALADEIFSRLPQHYARMTELCGHLERLALGS